MTIFELTVDPIDTVSLRERLDDPACGGFVSFEGRVRNHHQGSKVIRLEYEAYPKLAITEGNQILQGLKLEYALGGILCVHRTGSLEVGEIAVWVGAIAAHRQECFNAVSKAMSLIKQRVPIWKREFYADGSEAWVCCSHPHLSSAIAS